MKVQLEADTLKVITERDITYLPLTWIRDHCNCKECHHPDTKQRLATSFSSVNLAVDSICQNKDLFVITWKDNHTTIFTYEFIDSLRRDPENLDVEHFLWDSQAVKPYAPAVSFNEYMKNDTGIVMLLEQVERYGFCFVEGTPPTEEGTRLVADRIAYTRQTIFGGYYEMEANLEHKDTAYTPLAIGPHTDGTYSNDAPSYQVLHCLAEDCVGGENVLIDGFKIAAVMKDYYPDQYETLTQVRVPGQYIDTTRDIHLMARRPIFRLNEYKQLVQVSYNNHDRAPFYMGAKTIKAFYEALEVFATLCADPTYHYRRKLQPGSCLFFDNWRVLHARDAYSGYRKLAGVYFNKEDVESKLRVLRSKREDSYRSGDAFST